MFDVAPGATLPADIGDGRRFATGDARALTDAEALNLVHPLVRSAIDEARRWPGGRVELLLPPDALSDLAALAGSVGIIRVVLVDYAGFEPVQRLVAGAVIDGTPIDPLLAARIVRLQAADGAASQLTADSHSLDDAVDEAVFIDQRDVEKGEQKHFEQAIGQLERFVQDKVLVCRRERASIGEKLSYARARRDEVVGSTARDRIEAEIDRLATRDESLDRRINALESREDEVYRKWRDKYHELRYRPPTVRPLFEATFQISPPSRETVVLRLLHTADWHLGRRFPSFPEDAQKKLSRARMDVIANILDVARRNAVHALLCAGDLFDDPEPEPDFWEGLARTLRERGAPHPPIFLVPGNHDPLTPESVWAPGSSISSTASGVGTRRGSR